MAALPARSRFAILMILIAAAVAFSCGGDDGAAPDTDQPFNGTIRVLDSRFSPASVTIAEGDSVTWRWEGSLAHTVTHGTSPVAPEVRLFDTPEMTSGTFGYRFTAAGSYPYFCRPHFAAGMTGTVTVEAP